MSPLDEFEVLAQVCRYLMVGAVVTLVDVGLYNLLSGPRVQFNRITANVISVTFGMLLGFTLHFALVFRPAETQVIWRIVKYVITVGVSVYGVQNLVIHCLSQNWRLPVHMAQVMARNLGLTSRCSEEMIDRLTGKVIAVLAGMIWNYVWFKFFVYA
jgi:putative flippase GtrA